jgi:hypothetical protein
VSVVVIIALIAGSIAGRAREDMTGVISGRIVDGQAPRCQA